MTSTTIKAPRMNSQARFRSCREALKNIVDNAYRFYWTADFLNQCLREVYASPNWDKLRVFERTLLHGYVDGLRANETRMTTHCYLCQDGKFRRTTNVVNCGDAQDDYEPYKMPSERSPKSLVEDTCILVWKDKPDHVYSTAGCKFLEFCRGSYVEHKNSTGVIAKITLDLTRKA